MMKDVGIKMAAGTWGADRFAAVPKGTPKDIKEYLAHIINKTLADEKTHEAFKKVGIHIGPKTMAEQRKIYEDSYAEVYSYFKEAGELKTAP